MAKRTRLRERAQYAIDNYTRVTYYQHAQIIKALLEVLDETRDQLEPNWSEMSRQTGEQPYICELKWRLAAKPNQLAYNQR